MKNILLVCCAGMSTSLLVNRMNEAAKDMGEEAHIFALPVTDGLNHLSEVDCVLLGPQVRFEKSKIQNAAKEAGCNLPV